MQQLRADMRRASADLEQERALIGQQEKALIERDALIRDYEGQVGALTLHMRHKNNYILYGHV